MAPPPPPPRRRRSSPALMDELVEEILLRVPPDEPAHLVRAALVCKPWHRIVSDRGFLRRYRKFHRPPPLLAYIHILYYGSALTPRFIPTSAASPFSPPALAVRGWWALDCRHGRVLIETCTVPAGLVVWNPITGDQQHLSVPAYQYFCRGAAVLCATDNCDHLDCHGGPFRVVFVGTDINNMKSVTWATVYSSETSAWSALTSIDTHPYVTKLAPSPLIGDAIYFAAQQGVRMLKYDLGRHELSEIDAPGVFGAIIVKAEDRGLGFACVSDNTFYLLARQAGAIAIAGLGWEELRVIKFETLFPERNTSTSCNLIGYAEGTDILFIRRDSEVFTLELKSGKVRKVGEIRAYSSILPYMGVYTPDLAKGRLSPP